MTVRNIYVLISLVLAAVLFVWMTFAAIVALRKGERFGKTLWAWARGLVDIITGFG